MGRRKPTIRQINLRLDETLRGRLERAAKERRVSVNELMRQLLEAGLESEEKTKQSFEARLRGLERGYESLVQRFGPPLPLLEAARQKKQEEGGDT
jgi:hypothetical protein